MAQGFTSNLPIPLAVSRGGTGVTTSTGITNVVLSGSPTITTPNIVGTSTNDNAVAGSVGEVISSSILLASAVSITTGVLKDVTSISLTAGDWDVIGNVYFTCAGALTLAIGWIHNVSTTFPDSSLLAEIQPLATSTVCGLVVPGRRFSLATTTTIYLSVDASFSSTCTVCGNIVARRAR